MLARAIQIARNRLETPNKEGAATTENERFRHILRHRRKSKDRQSQREKKKSNLPRRGRERQSERKPVCEPLKHHFSEDWTIHHGNHKEKLLEYQVPPRDG